MVCENRILGGQYERFFSIVNRALPEQIEQAFPRKNPSTVFFIMCPLLQMKSCLTEPPKYCLDNNCLPLSDAICFNFSIEYFLSLKGIFIGYKNQ